MPSYDPNLVQATGRLLATPRESATTSITLTSGRAQLVGFTPTASFRVSVLIAAIRGTAAATITLARLGLYTVSGDGSATLVARGPASTALGGSTFSTAHQALDTTGGYPAFYDLVSGQRYAMACLWVATTPPAVTGSQGSAAINSWLPWLAMHVNSQTDLLTSYAVSAMTPSAEAPLMAAA